MFKKGDKVVCINNYNNLFLLKINKIYIIDDCDEKYVSISNIKFFINRFVSIKQFRKQKIKKICSKLGM